MSAHLFVTWYHSVHFWSGFVIVIEKIKGNTLVYSDVLFYAQLKVNSRFAACICQTEK